MRLVMLTVISFGALTAAPALAQTRDGATAFQAVCATCHAQPPPDSRAPSMDGLRRFAPEAIVTALITGNMFRQGQALTDSEKRAVAEFIAGRPIGAPLPATNVGRCASTPTFNPGSGASWNGWGVNTANTRYRPAKQSGIDAASVPKLKLTWAFGFAGVSTARAQPAVAGGRVFVASENGDGYAVDASTGQAIWTRKVDEHPHARASGSPTLHEGRLYVPIAGLGEEGQGGSSKYECCTFRGNLSALDANTGAVVWKTYTISEEQKPRAKNKDGVQTWGPAGGGIWEAPTIDARRRSIYIATGNGYAEPAQRTTDALIALDMGTGKIRWVNQVTPNDVWAGGCRPENPDNPNCPAKMGPDHDFSASPLLATRSNGQDLLVIPQKSGMAYALDPDKQGALVWQYRMGQGSGLGGQWGAAADEKHAYAALSAAATRRRARPSR